MTFSLVQSKVGTGTTSPLTVTLTSGTGSGNLLAVCVGAVDSTTNPTVSGITLGGSAGHFAVAKALANNADANAEIWADLSCAGAQTAVAVSFNAGSGTGERYYANVFEFTGTPEPGLVDKTNSGGASSGTAWSSGATGTLSQSSEIILGMVAAAGSAGNPTITAPGTWNTTGPTVNGVMACLSGYQIVSASTSLTFNSSTTNARWGAVIASIAAGGSGPSALLLKFP